MGTFSFSAWIWNHFQWVSQMVLVQVMMSGFAMPQGRLDAGVHGAEVRLAVGAEVAGISHPFGVLNKALGLLLGGRHGRHVLRVKGKDVKAPEELHWEAGAGPRGLFPREHGVELPDQEVP